MNANGFQRRYHLSNGFRAEPVRGRSIDVEEDEDEEEDVEDDDENDDKVQVEETYGEEGEEDLVEMHNVGDSDEDVDGVEGEGEEEVDEVDEDGKMRMGMGKIDQENVEDDGQPGCTGRLMSIDGEIDGHVQGEGDEDENGEIGEEDEQGVDDNKFSDDGDGDDDEDDDNDIGREKLVQLIAQSTDETVGKSFDACNEEDEDEVDDDEDLHSSVLPQQPSSSQTKRNRGDEYNLDDDSLEDL